MATGGRARSGPGGAGTVALAAGGIASAVLLAWVTVRTWWAVPAGDADVCAYYSGEDGRGRDTALAVILLAVLAATAVAWWFPRRPVAKRRLALASAGAMAVVAVLLGYATYLPTSGNQVPVLAPTAWVLMLFVGGVEPTHLCGDDADLPVGFQLARVLGLAATFTGAVLLALLAGRQQWDRLRIRFGGDVDVVVGLDPATLQLVERLAREDHRPEPAWYRLRPTWGDLRRRTARRPVVVVVTGEASHPLAERVQQVGARLEVEDPAADTWLRSAVSRWSPGGRRVTLRRLYALLPDPAANVDIYRRAHALLADTRVSRAHCRDVVPRIVVGMDDPREARAWRVENPGGPDRHRDGECGPEWFADAVSPDEVVAHALVQALLRHGTRHVVLVGDHSLAMAVLDELSWARWSRFDLVVAAAAETDSDAVRAEWREMLRLTDPEQLAPPPREPPGPGGGPDPLGSLADERAPVPTATVTLAGPTARRLRGEWEHTRAPWSSMALPGEDPGTLAPDRWWLPALRVVALDAHGDRLEEELQLRARWLARPPSGPAEAPPPATPTGDGAAAWSSWAPGHVAVVVVEPDPALLHMARRLAAMHPDRDLLVVVPGEGTAGVVDPPARGALARFGPTWLLGDQPLEDSWTELARQQHAAYRHRYGFGRTPGRDRPRGLRSLLGRRPEYPTQAAQAAWDLEPAPGEAQLPVFFRDDNLRQLRLILAEVGYRGRWLRAGAASEFVPPRTCEDIAAQEHARWKALREQHGWTPVATKAARHDGHRRHHQLVGWEQLDDDLPDRQNPEGRKNVVGQVVSVLRRLHATGLTTGPSDRD